MRVAESDRELKKCTFVKTAMMIIIVFYHSIAFWKGDWFSEKPIFASEFLSVLSKWINSFQIYVFVLISGYVFYYIKGEKSGYNSFWPFVKNKFKRLIVPYIFVSLIWALPMKMLFFKCSLKRVLYDFVLGTSPAQLWFLIMLFNVFLINYFLFEILKSKHALSAVIMLAIYGISVVAPKITDNYFQLHTTMKYCIFFFVGMKIRQFGSLRLRKIPIWVYVVVDIVLFVTKNSLDNYDMLIVKLLNIGLDLCLNMVGSLMIVVILWRISDSVPIVFRKIMDFLSKHAMMVYLIHQQIIYFCIQELNGIVNPYINCMLNFLISMGLSLLVSVFVHKSKYISFLFGEKNLK